MLILTAEAYIFGAHVDHRSCESCGVALGQTIISILNSDSLIFFFVLDFRELHFQSQY